MPTVIDDIELGIQQQVQNLTSASGEKLKWFALSDDVDSIVCPALNVCALFSGQFAMVTQGKYKLNLDVAVTICVQNVRNEHTRREHTYGFLMPLMGLLCARRLTVTRGLVTSAVDCKPLIPVRLSKEVDDGTRMSYSMWFRTAIVVDMTDTEVMENLLKISAQYFLKPGDTVLDAQDTIAVGEDWPVDPAP